ncbi:fimbrial protein [Erwiniaceae bacterium CAU 1747]
MKVRHSVSSAILSASLLISVLTAGSYVFAAEEKGSSDNLRFTGQLVAQPCIVASGNESMEVNFHSVFKKTLYKQGRSSSQSFKVLLSECDLSLGKTVRVSFDGRRSLALPGLLALNMDSAASGIAIGIETADGTPIPLGEKTSSYPLKEGGNEIDFKAYIQAEPDAISKENITVGLFNATLTFYLDYE